jgi:hypothetical protein
VAVVLVAVLAPRPAHADEAKESFEKGIELYKANDYQGALAEFLAAYKAKPHHAVLYNIAQCYQMIDAGADALHYYSLYLEEGADYISDSRRKLVEKEIEKLKGQLTPLTLDVEPDGAQVLIDGKAIGTSPVKVQYLDPGGHTFIVRKQGYGTHEGEFVAKRGEPLDIDVVLEKTGDGDEPENGAGTGAGEPPGDEVGDGGGGGEDGSDGAIGDGAGGGDGPAGEAKVHWGAAVGTGALTLASGVAAIVLGVMNSQHHDDYLALRGDIADGTYTGDDPDGDVRAAEDSGKALNAGVGVAIGVTAAAAVVTAVLVPLAIPKKNVEVQASGAGISVTVSF